MGHAVKNGMILFSPETKRGLSDQKTFLFICSNEGKEDRERKRKCVGSIALACVSFLKCRVSDNRMDACDHKEILCKLHLQQQRFEVFFLTSWGSTLRMTVDLVTSIQILCTTYVTSLVSNDKIF